MIGITRRRALALLGATAAGGLLGFGPTADAPPALAAAGVSPSPPWLGLPADTVLERIAFGS